jgi:hypothetical protein
MKIPLEKENIDILEKYFSFNHSRDLSDLMSIEMWFKKKNFFPKNVIILYLYPISIQFFI